MEILEQKSEYSKIWTKMRTFYDGGVASTSQCPPTCHELNQLLSLLHMGFVHFILQVREVEAEKMALQVQKAKLEVTSDKQISYGMSINVAHSLEWQNMCKLTNIIENTLRFSHVVNFCQLMHNRGHNIVVMSPPTECSLREIYQHVFYTVVCTSVELCICFFISSENQSHSRILFSWWRMQ